MLGSYHTNNREIEPQILNKFCQNQAVHGLDVSLDETFNAVLPNSYTCSHKEVVHADSLHLMHMSWAHLSSIDSFAWKSSDAIIPLSPFYENVFDNEFAQQLQKVYEQLYPGRNITHIPRFFKKFGHVLIAGELIGSDMRGSNSRCSSVVMAFWPNRGSSLNNIDYTTMRVGVVQYFLHHTLSYCTDNETKQDEHLFAYVRWKELHPCHDFYGVSATVCVDMFHFYDACCFLPVQRIACRCACITMPVNLNTVTETVFIASPVPLKYSA